MSEPRVIITGKREAAALAERLKSSGKIASVTDNGRGAFTVRWLDWNRAIVQPRGRWRDNGLRIPQ